MKKMNYQSPEFKEIVFLKTNNLTSTLSAPAKLDIVHEDIKDEGVWE